MGQLMTMARMDFQSNQLNGTIPMSIGSLTDMCALQLGGGQSALWETLPSKLGNLQKLEELTFHDNFYLRSGNIHT
jgi:hypothetical protein